MDSRFSIAVHLLVLIHVTDDVLSSSQMAAVIGSNPSFIRKILVSLKRADLIDSHQGRKGFALKSDPESIDLLEVYRAVYGRDDVELFRRKGSARGGEGQDEGAAMLCGVYSTVEESVSEALESMTLAQCIDDMRDRSGC